MRPFARVLICALIAVSPALVPLPSTAAATPEFPVMTVNLCSQLQLTSCPAGYDHMAMRKSATKTLPNGCRAEFNDFGPGLYYHYDPAINAYYNTSYAAVAVQVLCPSAQKIQVAAIAQPADNAMGTHEQVNNCNDTYCSASAAWGHNDILNSEKADYEMAVAQEGNAVAGPYFPSFTTAGVHTW